MGALISGFVGFFVIVLGLTFLIQYPAIFWVLLLLFVFALIFGFRKGRKQSVLSNPDREARRRAALNQRDGVSEGDVVHHHQPNGRPFDDRDANSSILGAVAAGAAAAYILRPDAGPNTPVVEPDPEIDNAAAMYCEGNDSYNEEEGEY